MPQQTVAGRRRPLPYFLAFIVVIVSPFLYSLWVNHNSPRADFAKLINLGKSYYEKGDATNAVAAFQAALALNPTLSAVRLDLALACLSAGRSEEAIKHAEVALEVDHNSAAAYYIIGCADLRLRRFEEAVKALDQASDIDTAIAAVSFQLGRAHQELGQWEDAAVAFRDAIKLETNHLAAHYALSQVLIRQGKMDEANRELERHRQLMASKPLTTTDSATFEKCAYTEIIIPYAVEKPSPTGIPVSFADVTSTAFGAGAADWHGPLGVIDYNHDGRNSLFVAEGDQGFRLLSNTNGVFHPVGPPLAGQAGAGYRRCLVADLQNDQFEDVIILGAKRSHVFQFATNGAVREVTAAAGLAGLTGVDGGLHDLDFTGNLDLMTVTPDDGHVRVFRNLGNMYFMETATSGVPASVTGVRQLHIDDWDNDDLADLFLTRDGQPPLRLAKQRGGALAQTNVASNLPSGAVIALGDLNNDLRTDLLVAAPGELIAFLGGLNQIIHLPASGAAITRLMLLDYDNDGWLDIIAAGDGLQAWRNLGDGKFENVTQKLGFDRVATGKIEALVAADFDNDGATDLLLAIEGKGLKLLRNEGGSANQQFKLRLAGKRSNASGLGMRVEVAASGLRLSRRVSTLPTEIGVGQHRQLDSLTVHWFDLAVRAVDVNVDPKTPLVLKELTLPSGSCPYLYTWDGERFRFVTDLLGAAPMGLRISDDHFIDADPQEFVWLGNEQTVRPRDGNYQAQITEELREVLYLDEAKLVVVDHPPGTEIHTTGKLLPGPPFPRHELVTLQNRRALRAATRGDGIDVTAQLSEIDGRVVSPVNLRIPQLRGLAEPYSVTLDFGALPVERPLALALTGWLRFGGGMANVAASRRPDLPFPFPTLEVEDADGKWSAVDVVVGAPAGKTKTIIVDLAGKLPAGSRRLRLSTAFEIHWDRIALFEKGDRAVAREYAPATADLHWRGFSEYKDLPWFVPLTPDYERVSQSAKWTITPMGWCTRYGDVRELIARRDDALALLNGGDELTLAFPAASIAPPTPGLIREFFLYTVGWDKDSDFHCERGWTVEPLPFHGMDDQRYGHQERPVIDGDSWIKKYNTRWVGQFTFDRQMR